MGNAATISATRSVQKARPFQAIFWGGLIVGALDLAYAIVMYAPHHPILIPQTIASGVLGVKSYSEGIASATLGVFFHFFIAFSAATVYFLASGRLAFLTRRAVVFGLLYGAIVFCFMQYVVLPLSAKPPSHMTPPALLEQFVEHWFFVGLPIALSVRHFAPR